MSLVSSCKFTDKKKKKKKGKAQCIFPKTSQIAQHAMVHEGSSSCPCKGRKSGLGFEKTRGLFAQVAEHRREK